MVLQQQSLFNVLAYCKDGKKPPQKRVHYKTPTYIKSYQFRVFNEETQEYQYYGDEKHILRIAALHKIYSDIYIAVSFMQKAIFIDDDDNEVDDAMEKKDGLILWHAEKQAEIDNTWQLPLKDRLKLHIKLLRGLRKGLSVKEILHENDINTVE